ncbi:hypothetical protein L202_01945 [Cryptococcus amylolentus CBS 6039]|uniref:Uncharacterized protein n=2 Tax=Cryptococcus amylolentus TaxID=104669 RepID=A0A1E3HYW1_9TREE|nr:hypothetical protein L202_01945 [Cryptococcus amylolentus CBS 6039]ODN81524.1 hypothetical protein L202_01945 [Cryptococcus amylolentus CBS 6039]ODO10244.1 hypothetical protein I350_02473 [Cryptococcus amylolentus CBS 6273]
MSGKSSSVQSEGTAHFWRRYELSVENFGPGVDFTSDASIAPEEYHKGVAERLGISASDVKAQLMIEYEANSKEGRWDETVINNEMRPSGKRVSLCSHLTDLLDNETSPPPGASLCSYHDYYESMDAKCPNSSVPSELALVIVGDLMRENPAEFETDVGETFLKENFGWSHADVSKASEDDKPSNGTAVFPDRSSEASEAQGINPHQATVEDL